MVCFLLGTRLTGNVPGLKQSRRINDQAMTSIKLFLWAFQNCIKVIHLGIKRWFGLRPLKLLLSKVFLILKQLIYNLYQFGYKRQTLTYFLFTWCLACGAAAWNENFTLSFIIRLLELRFTIIKFKFLPKIRCLVNNFWTIHLCR